LNEAAIDDLLRHSLDTQHKEEDVHMRYRSITASVLIIIAFAGTAAAKDEGNKEGSGPPPLFQAVLDCKAIADPTQRLACFDRSVATMETATANKDLVVADRSTMREARRGLFGLSLPKIKLFGGDDSEEVTEIEGTIASFRAAKDGLLIFELADGARWKQTEGRQQFPKVGDKVKIRKAALGSFMANIGEKTGFRVMRLGN
jgi:hypothetical protein